MTTPCQITLYHSDAVTAQKIAADIHANTRRLEKKYNFHHPDSWLNHTINGRSKHRVRLDQETRQVLDQVWTLSAQSGDVFDVCVGTLHHAKRQQPAATQQALREILSHALGTACWRLDGRFLELDHAETRLDLGGVIKEYAVDCAARIAEQNGCAGMINFGGDLRVLGKKPDGQSFRVGIKNPKKPSELLLSLAVENMAVTTSAGYERPGPFAVSQASDRKAAVHSVLDKQSSHILGADHLQGALSATVLAPSALSAGVLSTTLMLNTATKVPDGVSLVLVDQQGKVFSNLASV